MQFAGLKREGAVSISDNDFGFYAGGGAGIMIFLKDNIFYNLLTSVIPVTRMNVQTCGDAHLCNFGGFASPERNVIF